MGRNVHMREQSSHGAPQHTLRHGQLFTRHARTWDSAGPAHLPLLHSRAGFALSRRCRLAREGGEESNHGQGTSVDPPTDTEPCTNRRSVKDRTAPRLRGPREIRNGTTQTPLTSPAVNNSTAGLEAPRSRWQLQGPFPPPPGQHRTSPNSPDQRKPPLPPWTLVRRDGLPLR